MKTNTPLLLTLLAAASIVPALAGSQATHGDPYTPVGSLDVSKRLVRTGVKPMLSWEIQYPKDVTDIVEIDPKGQVKPKMDVLMEIRVVGAAFQHGDNHTPLHLAARVGNDSAWQTLFEGVDSSADGSDVVLSTIVKKGHTVDFSAKAQDPDGTWAASFDTLSKNGNVQALPDGAVVPDYVPAYNQNTIESFLTQYISSDNEVTIGPRDLIYLFELGTTNTGSSAFDMQDIVMVITFKDVPSN